MGDLRAICEKYDLDLAILYGSQARGTARADSDYDVGVRKREGLIGAGEFLDLAAELSQVLGTGRLDLVDLRKAPPLLKYEAARSGQALYEAQPGTFNLFHVLAWKMEQDWRYKMDLLHQEVK